MPTDRLPFHDSSGSCSNSIVLPTKMHAKMTGTTATNKDRGWKAYTAMEIRQLVVSLVFVSRDGQARWKNAHAAAGWDANVRDAHCQY
jgi:hypothetical protein